MRKPLPGEKPSGLFERTMFEIGREAWKLEPHEIEYLRQRLTEHLDKRIEHWLKKWDEENGKKEP